MTFLPPLPDPGDLPDPLGDLPDPLVDLPDSLVDLPDALVDEIHDLALACLSGEAKPEEVVRLDELVCTSDAVCKVYAQVIRDSHCLRRRMAGECLDAVDAIGQGNAGEFPPALALGGVPASPSFFGSVFHGTIGFLSQDEPFAILVAAVTIGLGLLVASVVQVSPRGRVDPIAHRSPPSATSTSTPSARSTTGPKAERVGRITHMADVKWAGMTAAAVGGVVSVDDEYALASGLVEITYDSGTKVILQGPATYEIDSRNGGSLAVGRLTARVEREAAKGFFVHTPVATVTDLGTEFGVAVDKDGSTTSHVFRGLVKVQVMAEGNATEPSARHLREDQSAVVKKSRDSDGRRVIQVIPSNEHRAAFVRTMPKRTVKQLDLVDVVAGGDGFSGRRESGIQPIGTPSVAPLLWRMHGDYLYHRVEGMPFVDGIFIPDGGRGPVQTDSAGHVCTEFPLTENITVARPIWAGHGVPVDEHSGVMSAVDVKVGGVDYSAPGHGLLLLIANQGITFDLDAVRRANSGSDITRFSAVVTNVDWQSPGSYFVDFWVLVDGKRCKRFRQMSALNGAVPVTVPLRPTDRFLTLAVTDGEDTIAGDYGVFGDPRLELMTDAKP